MVSRRIIDLNGDDWRLGQAPPEASPGRARWRELAQVETWLPARVPGNVRADLLRAGRLPDLAWGRNAEAAQWVDDHCWWLARDFSRSPAPGERIHLILRAVDYIGDVFLNGHHLARHEGMFSPQEYEITALLQETNRLAVRLLGNRWLPHDRSNTWEKLLNRIEARASDLAARFPERRDSLKCQMGFGWDFAPPLRSLGIWDDVYAVVSGGVFASDVAVRQGRVGEAMVLAIEVELDARRACDVALRCTLSGETFGAKALAAERRLQLAPGRSRHRIEMVVEEPHLWWPWDHGRPDLYRLQVVVAEGDGVLDTSSQLIGLRQVEMEGWTLHVNGRRVYARGANWVPADLLPGRVAREDYGQLLALAREANMNMLRVWGGGLREKRAFYELCDRLGILVWHEFPVACAFLTRYPRAADFLRLAETEARAIVRDLRNHPSLVLWCGGNEFDPERNAPLVAALRRAATAEDPDRPFLAASPAGGDSHYWQVWHDFRPATAYLDDRAHFASEFGLQAPPDPATLRRFIPEEELWPPGPSWAYHGADFAKLWRYARPFLEEQEPGLDAFVEASQHAQAHALQTAIEHYRRRKAQGHGGLLVWQLNEPWPAISWALLDFYRQPKPAYATVQRLLSPVLVSAEYPPRPFHAGEKFQARLWIVNDLGQALPGCRLEVTLRTGDGQLAEQAAWPLDVAADSARVVAEVDWTLPAGEDWQLNCRLTRQEQILSSNEYCLALYDGSRPAIRQRAWAWLRDRLLAGGG